MKKKLLEYFKEEWPCRDENSLKEVLKKLIELKINEEEHELEDGGTVFEHETSPLLNRKKSIPVASSELELTIKKKGSLFTKLKIVCFMILLMTVIERQVVSRKRECGWNIKRESEQIIKFRY